MAVDTCNQHVCSLLACSSEELVAFDEKDTDALSDELLTTILPRAEVHDALVAASSRYRLDRLLQGMLIHAPHPSGKRYTAISLHIAYRKGSETIVNVAQAWMEDLFLPMITLSIKDSKTKPKSSQSPTPTRPDTFRDDVRLRENYRCAITGSFDDKRVNELIRALRHREIPNLPQRLMEAAYIIPYSLLDNSEDGNSGYNKLELTRTRDMFNSWTNMDLTAAEIRTPANVIYMSTNEHTSFARFDLYFDKEAFPNVPNKYQVRMPEKYRRMSNGHCSADVEFGTDASGVEPPSPELLKIHASLAQVLHLSGAAKYVRSLQKDTEDGAPLPTNPTEDFATRLRLAFLAH